MFRCIGLFNLKSISRFPIPQIYRSHCMLYLFFLGHSLKIPIFYCSIVSDVFTWFPHKVYVKDDCGEFFECIFHVSATMSERSFFYTLYRTVLEKPRSQTKTTYHQKNLNLKLLLETQTRFLWI